MKPENTTDSVRGQTPAPAVDSASDDDIFRNPMEGYKVLIVGLGNVLLGDDGVGIHAIRELQKNPPQGALAVEVGTAILASLHLLEAADRIIALDAVHAGKEPGTVYRFDAGKEHRNQPVTSVHEMGILNTLSMMAPAARPPDVKVIGVEPEVIGYGMELSPTVAKALPGVLEEARRIVAEWVKD